KRWERLIREDHARRNLERGKPSFQECANLFLAYAAAFAAVEDGNRHFAQSLVGGRENARFGNPLASIKRGFDLGRGNVFSAANDDVLLAIDDEQIAVRVEIADIAGFQISIGGEGRGGRF